jgi:hypothetical protein
MATLVLELEKNIKQISNESLITQPWELDKKQLDELHADKTIVISADHPLAIAAERARENHRKGKTLSPEQILDMIKRGEYDFD